MRWVLLVKYFLLRFYRRVVGVAEFLVMVRVTYQIDDEGVEIPGSRVLEYCVRNDITDEVIQCFADLESAKELCGRMNNPAPRSKF